MDGKRILLIFMGFFGGSFSIAGAIFNWDWFMNDSRAQVPVFLLGHDGARIFYFIIGLFLIGLGLFGVLMD